MPQQNFSGDPNWKPTGLDSNSSVQFEHDGRGFHAVNLNFDRREFQATIDAVKAKIFDECLDQNVPTEEAIALIRKTESDLTETATEVSFTDTAFNEIDQRAKDEAGATDHSDKEESTERNLSSTDLMIYLLSRDLPAPQAEDEIRIQSAYDNLIWHSALQNEESDSRVPHSGKSIYKFVCNIGSDAGEISSQFREQTVENHDFMTCWSNFENWDGIKRIGCAAGELTGRFIAETARDLRVCFNSGMFWSTVGEEIVSSYHDFEARNPEIAVFLRHFDMVVPAVRQMGGVKLISGIGDEIGRGISEFGSGFYDHPLIKGIPAALNVYGGSALARGIFLKTAINQAERKSAVIFSNTQKRLLWSIEGADASFAYNPTAKPWIAFVNEGRGVVQSWAPKSTIFANVESAVISEGVGPYKIVKGHHPLQKAAFVGHPNYNYREVLAVSEGWLSQFGIENIHPQISIEQRILQNDLKLSGRQNTMAEQLRISWQAMERAGVPRAVARKITAQAYWDLKGRGVKQPIRLPWGEIKK